ncbi:MAG: hypothetical protein GQ557_00325 [Mycoplasmataceae bacterium]|nr:hypothetical protein [Mycoplasmataceae bacterium]
MFNNKLSTNKITKTDNKLFISWAKKNPFLFNNPNFLTGLYNINRSKKITKNELEFSFFNRVVLNNKYELGFNQSFVLNSNSKLNNYVEQFIFDNLNKSDNFINFIIFYNEITKYIISKEQKDWKREFDLLNIYWKFLDDLEHGTEIDFNNWVIYINKNIYQNQKGFNK